MNKWFAGCGNVTLFELNKNNNGNNDIKHAKAISSDVQCDAHIEGFSCSDFSGENNSSLALGDSVLI